MMFVNGPGPVGAPRIEAARPRAGTGAAFSVPQDAAAPAAEAAEAAAPVAAAALDGMLALQEAGSHEVRDRQARRHGLALLGALGRLQRALLGGGDTADSLRDLASLAQAVPDAADPALRRIVREVATRACVELARHGLPAING